MASSIEARTICRSIDFSRATASAICKSSSLLALTAICVSCFGSRAGPACRRQFGLVRFALLEFRPHASGQNWLGLERASPRLGTLAWRRFPSLICNAGSLALSCFRGPQGLADKRRAQNQPCLGDVAEQKHSFGGFAWLGVAAIKRQHGTSAFAFDVANKAAEALAPANAGRHLDPCFPCKSASEIRDANEQTIDPRRGNFEAIGPFYRILDIEDGRQSRAHDFAIIEVHRSVGTFCHDLHCHSRLRRKLDPDQPVSETGQNRLRNMRHTRGNSGFLDQARFIEDALSLRLHAIAVAIQTLPVHRGPLRHQNIEEPRFHLEGAQKPTKKSGSRGALNRAIVSIKQPS